MPGRAIALNCASARRSRARLLLIVGVVFNLGFCATGFVGYNVGLTELTAARDFTNRIVGPELAWINEAVAGTWKAGYKPFGLAMGPKASGMVVCGGTPEQKAKLEEIKKMILDGKIKVLEG